MPSLQRNVFTPASSFSRFMIVNGGKPRWSIHRMNSLTGTRSSRSSWLT
jgi:hypothetical protein